MLVSRVSRTRLFAVLAAVSFGALLVVGQGCSSADDAIDDATAQGVESGLNSALADTVVPVVNLLGTVPDIVNGGAFLRPGGLACPDTSGVCAAGSVVCTPTGADLTFTFDQCVVQVGDPAFTLDGVLVATPGDPIALTLTALFINSSAAMTGTGSASVSTCTYVVNVSTTDPTSVVGTIVQCDGNYPSAASHVTISFGDVSIDVTFDGSATAHATATKSGNLVANCTIDLTADPLVSSCSAP